MYHCNSLLINHDTLILFLMCICSSCVPIFFILNGYLTLTPEKTNFNDHLHKSLHLFLLITIWSILLVTATTLIRGEIVSIKWIYNKILENAIGYCNWIWFLHSLLILYLLKPIIQYILNSKIIFTYIWIIVGIFSIGLPTCDNIISLFSTKVNLTYLSRNINPLYGWPSFSLFYFMSGIILNNAKQFNNKIILISMFLSLILAAVIASSTTKIFYDPVWDGYNTIYTAVIAFGICLILLHNTYNKIPYLITIIGNNTLGIYLIEAILITYIKTIIKPTSSIITYLCIVFIILIMSTFLTLILKKVPLIKKLFTL